MPTIFTKGTTTVVPLLITGYSSTKTSRNTIHNIIGTALPDVTFAPAGLRTGSFELVFSTLAEARTAEDIFSTVGTVIFSDTDLPALNMTFVTNGDIKVELDSGTRAKWLVSVDFQEVQVA